MTRLLALFFCMGLASLFFGPNSVQASTISKASFTGIGEQLGLSPFYEWKTLTTEHFRVTYPQELQELAQIAAKDLEEAHRLLSPLLQWTPRNRTQIVLVDNSDFANGLTAATARLGIILWATPPDNWMSIAHYDNWFRLLCLHEYAHFLNLDATRDFWDGLRVILGDSTLPNAFWPTWMLEGLAVTVETAFTKAGRGRSSYYSMILRAAEQGGVLSDPKGLWRMSGPRSESPGGEVPYLFGHALISKLAQNDLALLGELSKESSGSFPWKLNSYSKAVSDKDWKAHWNEWQSEVSARAKKEIADVRAAGETRLEPITTKNYSTLGIAFSPDGKWMAYSRESMDRRQGVYLRDLRTGQEQRISDQLGGATMGFTADSQALVFSRVDRRGLYQLYSDLWVYDTHSKDTTRLSFGARYRDPSVARRGDWIAFTVNEPGRTSLGRARLIRDDQGGYRLESHEILYRPEILGRVSTPRIAPDGLRIVFSLHENNKVGESIWELYQDGGWSRRQVTADSDALDRFPFFDSAGNLFFVSNRSGIDNVYRWDASKKLSQAITNVTTGLWLPAFSEDGRLAASHYQSSGWDAVWVHAGSSQADSWRATPPKLDPVVVPQAQVASLGKGEFSEGVVSDYSVFPSIFPRSWGPFAAYGTVEGWTLGAALVGFDALDVHRYFTVLEYRPQLSEWGVDLTYSNRKLGAVWTIEGSRGVNSLYTNFFTRKFEAGLGVSLYFPRTYSFWNPSLKFSWEREEYVAYPANRSAQGSGVLALYRSEPTVTAELNYQNALSSRQSIWPEEGFQSRFGNKWYLGGKLGSLGGRPRTTNQVFWSQNHFLHLGNHIVLSPRWRISAANRKAIRLEGRSGAFLDMLGDSDFDQLVVRGYPQQLYFANQAGVSSLDLRFPIKRVERGWYTYPVFLETIQGMGFLESSLRRESSPGAWSSLPSYGAGLLADLTLFYSVPVSASIQYHQGLSRSSGGKGEAFIDLRLGQLSF